MSSNQINMLNCNKLLICSKVEIRLGFKASHMGYKERWYPIESNEGSDVMQIFSLVHDTLSRIHHVRLVVRNLCPRVKRQTSHVNQ